jgi:flagellar basal-body rod protein FlgB
MWSVNPTLDLLTKSIDVAALRHSVHASNVANANVDGYQRLEVLFAPESLSAQEIKQMTATDLQEASRTDAEIVASTDGQVRLDEEMAQMAQNALRYQALLGAFERTVGMLRTAARDGRGGG